MFTHYLESIDPEKKVERRKERVKKAKSREISNLATSPVHVNENMCLTCLEEMPQKVKDDVYLRDEGRCTFVNADGKRCEATRHLKFDHLLPFAK